MFLSSRPAMLSPPKVTSGAQLRTSQLAGAVRATLEAQSYAAAMQIVEMEEYLAWTRHEDQSVENAEELLRSLRENKAVIDMKGLEAATTSAILLTKHSDDHLASSRKSTQPVTQPLDSSDHMSRSSRS
jgi:hypothetical protein